MKLLEILARDLTKWPIEAFWIGQACDGDLHINDSDNEFICHTGDFMALADDWNTAEVNQAQWQAERDRQKGGEWKRHRGGKQPVANDVEVEYKFRDGSSGKCLAEKLMWDHQKQEDDVMQYRIISQPQAEEVEVKDTTIGTLSYKISVDQIAGPLAWRDTIIHCQAIIEDCEREIQRNVDLLDAEGLYMQLNAKVGMAYGEPDVDMSDWRNLKEGDIIECGEEGWSSSWHGSRVTVKGIERADYDGSLPIYALDDNGGDDWGESYTFIRRP